MFCFIEKYSHIYGKRTQMTPEFQEILLDYSWPGNCRELEHIIESSLVFLEPKEDLALYHLPYHIRAKLQSAKKVIENVNEISDSDSNYSNLKDYLEEVERQSIQKALKDNKWNITQTAKAIGYTRSNLQYRISKLNISFSS